MPQTPADNAEFEHELAEYRHQIDALDNRLIALFKERIGIIEKVGGLKRRFHAGKNPIRAGREADMVRRIAKEFEGSSFLPAAAAAIWRLIISASIAVEGSLKLSIYTPERDERLYWLAREYFGVFLPVSRQPHVKRVIGDVMDGKASIGIVPTLQSYDTSYWWTNLVQPGAETPKIFAYLPFIQCGPSLRDAPAGFAIAHVKPEETGDDLSIFVIEADHNVSQHRLQTGFAQAKLETNWINIATLFPESRHHLIEIRGFVTMDSPAMKNFINGLGSAIVQATFLGAYAVPMKLSSPYASQEAPTTHHANYTLA